MDNNYKALARKWRPKKFTEFVGQENIVKILTSSLDNQRLHHAYLFSGTRGVGKTTLARLIAKCISCQNKVSSSPCEKCSTCQSINQGSYLDLIEVDAASKTKVEDTRELLDNIQFSPSIGKFKIYIIDEVHMLSKHSFNALLKTLEEPPEHVKFIFATTEVDKLPVTIISRCIHFKLKAITEDNIQDHLIKILNEENITFENSAIAEIAKSANGSIRDSLSILEQCIAFCENKITLDKIYDILGTIKHDHIYELFSMVIKQNATGALHKIAKLAELSIDFNKMIEDIISLLHNIALSQASSQLTEHL
ncbi:MAG: DNA polymerase III subunit gamma/tau, partial [Legionellales bacterium]|nr:DNA polymerase III subunit gamma/tau [Legionellales bacterium]